MESLLMEKKIFRKVPGTIKERLGGGQNQTF